jgi:monoterpene epsilon-lactone hydrolase
MTDRSEIEAIRALLSSKPRPAGWAERRQRLDEVGSVWPEADDVKRSAVDLDGIPGEWSIAPGSDESRVLMFFHGGGYCSGSIASHRRMVTEAGRCAGARTLAVGYRLAPEHPFPAAFDDALVAWRFLRRQGIAAARIAVGGDSAGGGLTAALTNRLSASGDEKPACAWLVSPWIDLTMSGSTMASKDATDPLIHKPNWPPPISLQRSTGRTRVCPRSLRTCADSHRCCCRSGPTRPCSMMRCGLLPPPAPRMSPLRWRFGCA